MEFTEQERDTIKRAEKAVERAKFQQPMVVALALSVLLLMAFDVLPRSEEFLFLLVVFMCLVPALRSRYSPPYEELVKLLSKRVGPPDPIIEALTQEQNR